MRGGGWRRTETERQSEWDKEKGNGREGKRDQEKKTRGAGPAALLDPSTQLCSVPAKQQRLNPLVR